MPIIYTIIDLFCLFISSTIPIVIFISLYEDRKYKSILKVLIYIILIISTFVAELIFDSWIELIFIALFYMIFHTKKYDSYLITVILVTFLTNDFLLIFMTLAASKLSTSNDLNNTIALVISTLFEIILTIILILLIEKFRIKYYIHKKNNIFLNMILGYTYLVMFFLAIALQYFKAYIYLINGVIIFMFIQGVFMIFALLSEQNHQKKKYENKLIQEQVKNLKNYTDQLENDQLKLRRFKHDYKNLLHSLEINIYNKKYDELESSIESLDNYSNKYLNNISTEIYRDLGNIKIPYLKSLLISKLNEMVINHITCRFECRYPVTDVSMNQFDFIRLLGISIDNATESVRNIADGKIDIGMIQKDNSLICIIKNTSISHDNISVLSENGYTTKKSHEGLGISNIKSINKSYPNLFIQYSNESNLFTIKITITEV